ncbi:MAG: tRNA (N6-threonylcarbamoyladenosine(37)-N6)-methyltransferase TrmO [Deltaproteobacteria bacterium]|nr:tRNA (N6-threonylcarbamoyladenosine(37)-N6)-methyltransferase TrmO [Deltaproteobacteria bacterium]
MDEILFKPIGYVATDVTERVDDNWGEVISRIDLQEEYTGSLLGLADFSHAIIVTFLHQAEYNPARHLQRRPRGLAEMPKLGIFSQRVKNRPNPIGITTVEIIEAGDRYLEIRGLDAVNGTPILDIKPYFPHFDRVQNPLVPEWVNKLMEDYF